MAKSFGYVRIIRAVKTGFNVNLSIIFNYYTNGSGRG